MMDGRTKGEPSARTWAFIDALPPQRSTLLSIFVLAIIGLPFHDRHCDRIAEVFGGLALLIFSRWAWFEPKSVLDFFLLALTWSLIKRRTFPDRLLWVVRAGAVFSFYCLVAMMIALATGYRGPSAEFTISGFIVREAVAVAVTYFFLRRSAWPMFPLRITSRSNA